MDIVLANIGFMLGFFGPIIAVIIAIYVIYRLVKYLISTRK